MTGHLRVAFVFSPAHPESASRYSSDSARTERSEVAVSASRHSLALALCLALGLAASALASPSTAAPSISAAEATASAQPTPTVPATLTITAVGDICFASAPGRLIASKGPKAPFAYVASTLRDADLTLGNLECALSKRGSAVAGKAFTFRGNPRAVQGLQYAGFDMVSLGNNHARDYGSAALMDTVSTLDKARIKHAGAGRNASAAFAPVYVRSQETTVAFLSYCQIGPANFAAGKHRAGTAYTLSLSKVKAAVRAAKKKASLVVVSFHWGVERQYTPTSRQIAFGHGAIQAGADLVLSEHPHVIQGVEFYHRKLIAYSLGNFVFSPGSASGHDSMILRIRIGPHGIASVTARPATIGSGGAPRLAAGATARRIIGIIRRTSRQRGSHVKVSGTTVTITP
jgi:poly-gamma-glutamate capsule biosynthesis protein CapA/YwtB (metallophosphatase superfamily)